LNNKNKIDDFKNFINRKFLLKNSFKKKKYISKISISSINTNFYKDLNILGPFGVGNMNPVFLIEQVKVYKTKIINDKYISFFIKSKTGKFIPAISFRHMESKINKNILNNKNYMNVLVQIKENLWNNKKNLQLILYDIIV